MKPLVLATIFFAIALTIWWALSTTCSKGGSTPNNPLDDEDYSSNLYEADAHEWLPGEKHAAKKENRPRKHKHSKKQPISVNISTTHY